MTVNRFVRDAMRHREHTLHRNRGPRPCAAGRPVRSAPMQNPALALGALIGGPPVGSDVCSGSEPGRGGRGRFVTLLRLLWRHHQERYTGRLKAACPCHPTGYQWVPHWRCNLPAFTRRAGAESPRADARRRSRMAGLWRPRRASGCIIARISSYVKCFT